MLSAHEAGVDRRVIAEANSLAAHGRTVTLVETSPVRPDELHAAVRWFGSASSPTVRARHALRQRLRRLPTTARASLRALEFRLGLGADRSLERYFESAVPRQPYGAIHCHDLPTLPAALALKDSLPGSPSVIYDSHELFPAQLPDSSFERYWERRDAEFAPRADAVIAVNQSVADCLQERTGCTRPVVIYNSFGLDRPAAAVGREELAARMGDPEPGFVVVSQGYWTADRNLEALIAAFDRLGPDVRLYVFGKGDLERRMRRAAARAAHANVFISGWVPPVELVGLIAAADLGVIPYSGKHSLNHRFCTPNKLFEFIEAGLPICANDLPELRRIVGGSGIGHVAPMESSAEIADAIRDARERVGRGCYPPETFVRAGLRYGWAQQERELLGLYGKLGC